MPLDPQMLTMMSTTIVVSTAGASSYSNYGVETFSGSGSTLTARVVHKSVELRGEGGDVRHAVGMAWIGSTAAMSTGVRMYTNGAYYRVVQVERQQDEDGRHHTKVWFG